MWFGVKGYVYYTSSTGALVFSVNTHSEEAGTVRCLATKTVMNKHGVLLVVLPHAILTVEVEGVYSGGGAKQVVELGFHGHLCETEKLY